MNLNELNTINQLDEDVFSRYTISKKSGKLIKRLKNRRDFFKNKLENPRRQLSIEKRRELKEKIYAIDKSLPVIEKFQKYFIKLEKAIEGMPEKDRRRKIKSKYDEVKTLFFRELYYTMQLVSYNASIIIASIIATLIISIVVTLPIPGSSFVLAAPAILLIKNLREQKKRIHDKKFEKEIDFLIEKLESKKKKNLKTF